MIPLLYLNLDRDTDRRRIFEAAAEARGVQPQRLSALTPASMPDGIARRFRADHAMMPGEVGCFASHIAAWEMISRQGGGWHVVCEDDAALQIDPESLVRMLDSVRVARPFVQLCGQLKSSALLLHREGDLRLVRPLFTIMNATAYALRAETASALLGAAFELGLPVDGFLRKFGRVHLDMLAVTPAPFGTHAFASTTMANGRRGTRSRVLFRGSRFSLRDEARFVSRFGALGFVRVYAAYLAMKTLRKKTDPDGRFEVSA